MTDHHQPAQPRAVAQFPVAAQPADPCVEFDAEWRYTVINPAALQDMQRPITDLLGRCLWDAWPGLRESPIGLSFLSVMQTREPYRARQGGFQQWTDVFTHVTPLPSGGVRVVYRHAAVSSTPRKQRRA